MLPLQTTGGEGRRWWFLNGEPLTAEGASATLNIDRPDRYQLVVMGRGGANCCCELHRAINVTCLNWRDLLFKVAFF
ncbi:hypothetical protein ACLK2E_13980 [Escherichia coli]